MVEGGAVAEAAAGSIGWGVSFEAGRRGLAGVLGQTEIGRLWADYNLDSPAHRGEDWILALTLQLPYAHRSLLR